jgi:hypothetical protein
LRPFFSSRSITPRSGGLRSSSVELMISRRMSPLRPDIAAGIEAIGTTASIIFG